MSKPIDSIGTDGFEFVEFACENPDYLQGVFSKLGFSLVGKHRSKNVLLYKQNDIHFLINAESEGQSHHFAQTHGDSANGFALRVKDANHAMNIAVQRGAKPVETNVGPMELSIPAFEGVGGSHLYLVDRYGDRTIYDVDFDLDETAFASANGPLTFLDHLTHNLFRGNLSKLARFL